MSSNILARADALMQRRRQSGGDADDVPVLTDAIDPDSDIPVLLDAEPAAKNHTGNGLDDEMLDLVAHELAWRVHERLAAELPAIVANTVRDFLAEPEIRALLNPRD
jgi:hypothetical protein